MTHYSEAITRAMGLITALEAIVAYHRIDLDNPEKSLEMLRWKREELESSIANVQDLTEKLGSIASPEAKLQLQCTLQEIVSKNSALTEAATVKEAEIQR